MSISFSCEFCGKKIQAPDTAGGKWGKCPACHNKLFVPPPDGAGGDLKLAPLDEEDLRRQEKMLAETFKLHQHILSEKEVPEEEGEKKPVKTAANVDTKKLTAQIVTYLQYMVNGELDKADKLANTIKPAGDRAADVLDQIAYGEMPVDELENVPHQVLFGMIKELQEKLRL